MVITFKKLEKRKIFDVEIKRCQQNLHFNQTSGAIVEVDEPVKRLTQSDVVYGVDLGTRELNICHDMKISRPEGLTGWRFSVQHYHVLDSNLTTQTISILNIGPTNVNVAILCRCTFTNKIG
jgi:hypothetical protein